MGDHWFRFYDDVIHDVKVQALSAPMFKSWVNVLCIVSNNGGCLPALNAVAWALRVDEAAAFETITALRKAGLLDAGEGGALVPHNWEGRQFITDQADGSGTPAAVRARKWREKKAAEKAALEAAGKTERDANGLANTFANGSSNAQGSGRCLRCAYAARGWADRYRSEAGADMGRDRRSLPEQSVRDGAADRSVDDALRKINQNPADDLGAERRRTRSSE